MKLEPPPFGPSLPVLKFDPVPESQGSHKLPICPVLEGSTPFPKQEFAGNPSARTGRSPSLLQQKDLQERQAKIKPPLRPFCHVLECVPIPEQAIPTGTRSTFSLEAHFEAKGLLERRVNSSPPLSALRPSKSHWTPCPSRSIAPLSPC